MTIATTDLLRLTQWLSPAFPTSAYAYSHGLETAIAEGRVTDADSLRGWCEAVLRFGAGALDVWAIRAVLDGSDPDEVNDLLRARAGSAERWAETRDQGAAFAATTEGIGGERLKAGLALPVALALRAREMEAGIVAALYLQGLAGQLVSAGQRMLPLGQVEAQAVLADLHPVIVELAGRPFEEQPPGSAAFAAEIDAMRHEALQPRMFRT
ncbi:urease accessory protein UreF [Jannaschia aquimarina]|uniref:Urease accessory protein UreF n=1 Tax=Jannaschia aquimarina TaxID=935700 RepID=A0A0D1CMW1_9RHOB|nr:urease accessory UreF family protein [Jannaschia aquimarina]KIT16127.1 Urease accessory protein UreF [Jannaschia aquimarina]SNT37374.1 urease accessory protein [Jannaschia aquimarina]